jgi:hypothetical protein
LVSASKSRTIKRWIDSAADAVVAAVRDHIKDSWSEGALTEKLLRLPYLWLRSTLEPQSSATPASELSLANSNEKFVAINWDAELDPPAQTLLWKRWLLDYERATMIVTNPAHRKKFRKTPRA